MDSLRKYVDEFFFFGQLRTYLKPVYGVDVVKPTENGSIMKGWNGYTQTRAGECRLRVNTGTGDRVCSPSYPS